MEKNRYQVTQDNQEYILSTYIDNNKIIIECQDNNFTSNPTYRRDYSLQELKSFSEIFSFINTPLEALNELNNSIDRQQVKITNKGEIMEILFNVQFNSYSQELTFQLPLLSKSNQNYIQTGPMTKISEPVPQQSRIRKLINRNQFKKFKRRLYKKSDAVASLIMIGLIKSKRTHNF